MTYKLRDVIYEIGRAWVLRRPDCYAVMVMGITHSESDSSYARDADGLSIAVARANYLGRMLALREYERACRLS